MGTEEKGDEGGPLGLGVLPRVGERADRIAISTALKSESIQRLRRLAKTTNQPQTVVLERALREYEESTTKAKCANAVEAKAAPPAPEPKKSG